MNTSFVDLASTSIKLYWARLAIVIVELEGGVVLFFVGWLCGCVSSVYMHDVVAGWREMGSFW